MRKRIVTGVAALGLALSPVAATAGGSSHALEQAMVEMADTPEEHQALANYFMGRAKEARAEAGRHESMAKTYAAGRTSQKLEMRRHCESIAKDYSEMASQYEALAKLHKEAAKGAE